MGNITLGQIFDTVIKIGAVIGALGGLYALLMKGFDKKLQPIKDDIRDEKFERLKSDLTTFIYLASISELSDGQRIRMYEEYDDYIKMGGNSHIKEDVEILKKEGKI